MQSNKKTKFLPIFSEDKKVEVSLENDQAVIKLSTWNEDLGWFGQKTLALDAEMLDELHRVIASARYRLNSQQNADDSDSANVISFPAAR